MEESTTIFIIVSAFLLVGIFGIFFSSEFNFRESELNISGTSISETLVFSPDKEYHTLFRNFVDPLVTNEREINSIIAKEVSCSNGRAYVKTNSGCFSEDLTPINCPEYTENNEYGCSFGNHYGFFPSNSYTISATYELNPSNIFRIDGKDYIKFVVYSPGKHKFLSSNFKVFSSEEIVRKNRYFPSENVIIYIPYSGDLQEKNIILLKDFQFDSSFFALISYLVFFFPAIAIFFIWFFFGRDPHIDMPHQLSIIPDETNKRKPWQIAAFFNPPFASVDKNLFAATMLDFYHRKIIDVKTEKAFFGEKLLVKILKSSENLDPIELKIYEILKSIEKEKGKFFELKTSFGNSFEVRAKSRQLQKEVKKISKEIVSVTGITILTTLAFISFYVVFFFLGGYSISPAFVIVLIAGLFGIIIFSRTSAVFSRHKKDYYREYLHWQAFKRYLKNSFSIKNADHKTIVMWEDYLIYATALGVPKKVIKELEANHIITAAQAKMYTGIYVHTSSFATASGAASGGHGGAGGGGVGGGGGGGR